MGSYPSPFTDPAISLILRFGYQGKTMRTRMLRCGVVLLALAACATAPEGVVKEGAPFDFTSAHTPYSAAICIARNAKAMGGGITGEERLLGDSSTEGVMSKVAVWVSRTLRADSRGFAHKLMTGC